MAGFFVFVQYPELTSAGKGGIHLTKISAEMGQQDLDNLAQELFHSMDKEDLLELIDSLDALARLIRLQYH